MQYVEFGNVGIVKAIALTVVASILVVTVVTAQAQNLLPNGGLEIDADGNGIPDGWLGQPHNFSSETLEDEYSSRSSRFGQLPVPEGLELGTTTCVIHNLQPHEQTVSEPIAVKPNTGYRLSYWFRMSGGAEEAMFHILSSDAPRNALETLGDEQIISGKNLGWAYVPSWRRYEIPFRTGPTRPRSDYGRGSISGVMMTVGGCGMTTFALSRTTVCAWATSAAPSTRSRRGPTKQLNAASRSCRGRRCL